MESLEQTSLHSKRKLTENNDQDHLYSFDIEHDPSTKSFCSRSPASSSSANYNHYSLGNYQQTTKIIQEFNIQQLASTSDITVSSTINIKSTPKQPMKTGNQDLLSEADFQRVVQDITPADRDLFDEFLHGMKHKTDDFSFLSSLDETCTSSSQQQQHDSTLRRQSSLSQPASSMSTDRRAHHLPRGPNTIHYSPNSMPISTRPTSAAAAQTLKQMAVHHQQRIMYNYQQHSVPSYTSYPPAHSMRPFYQQSRSVSENDELSDPIARELSTPYNPVQTPMMPAYNPHSQQQQQQQQSQMYAGQSTAYPSSVSSSYQQHLPTVGYCSPNGLPSTAMATFPSARAYAQEDNLSLLDF